ncbi:MAG: FAD-binding protein [Acidobacteria bacterium]|nr:FAD-binding protein [Acidobacteriota bacterium]
MEERVKKEVKKIVGKEGMTDEVEDLVCYSYDATNRSFLPDVVVYPENTSQVVELVRLAVREKFPLIPRGAGCGYTGGSVPLSGGMVLVFSRMDRIIEIDEDNLIAVAEPGVVTSRFREEVEKRGLFYPPDPASLEYCTLGGNVAENAGGPRAFKYGVTREYVLGLEVVLPSSEVIDTGSRVMKDVVGYDLTRLFVGSEGTLGIITRITLKLKPLPESRRTMRLIYKDVEDAGRTVSSIIKNKIVPSALELMDASSIRAVEEAYKLGLSPDIGAILIIEVDGSEAQVKEEAEKVIKVAKEHSCREVLTATTPEEEEEVWRVRRSISPALAQLKSGKINEDVVVPRSEIPTYLKFIRELSSELGILIVCFGHAGDGNIHTNFMYERGNREEEEKVHQAVERTFNKVIELKGSISGEHGIGFTKKPYLTLQLSPSELSVMRRIKKLFDPEGILNPGKIFPEEG